MYHLKHSHYDGSTSHLKEYIHLNKHTPKVNQMLMHILLDEETNNIIILQFQGLKGSKTKFTPEPGAGFVS